ncbi:MAG: LLM class flavin-dependent oxidoreductase [bacterium]|nr:LLM class flavin-dependent oxidoreductase [bacterium]
MSNRVPLSILDLVSVSEGQDAGEAIGHAMEAAVLADRLGYERLWYAEHHNTEAVASAATQVLIGRAAGLTSRIRVGSGGVMLPNHAPLMVAEQYGTLAQLFPGRIDLGLGRAPGTDRMTAHALNRTSADPQAFAEAVWDLVGWFSGGRSHSINIEAGVAAGTNVPIWVLGSTTSGASIAGQLGLPFSIAAHFAPDQVEDAIAVYRQMFTTDAPTSQISEPRVMVGVNVLVAETDEEAQFQFSTHQQMFLSVRRGTRHKLLPPVPVAKVGSVSEVQALDSMLRVRAVGSPETVRRGLESLVERTGADELITTTYTYDPAVRLESIRLLAEAWGLEATS